MGEIDKTVSLQEYKAVMASKNHWKARCLELEENHLKLYTELFRIKDMTVWQFIKFKTGL